MHVLSCVCGGDGVALPELRRRARPPASPSSRGDDRLRGLAGSDTLTGGADTDTVDYGTFVPVNGRRLPRADENVDGSSFDDRLFGNGQANRLRGFDGRDHIVGAGGQDRLRGGDDPDTILARDGALDNVFGDAGRDRARRDQGLDVVRGVEVFL